ncbi:MAG: FAD-dependent oxidoreductase [bacterium]|nr:FAD-dependent oxidoreductase [bacterium]
MKYDIAIIGAGPAGLSAAIYAVRKGYKVLLISKDVGGQVNVSGEIENYLGFSTIEGVELVSKFKEHVDKFKDIDLIEGKEIVKITQDNKDFILFDKDKTKYQANSVIIATGREPRWLGIPGEDKFKGKGVSACATCDSPFFKNKEVIIIGGGNSGLEAANMLSKFASKITFIINTDKFVGDQILVDIIKQDKKINVIYDNIVTEIKGGQVVESVLLKNLKNNKEEIVKTDGVFVAIGSQPTPKIEDLTDKDSGGAIKVNGDLETNIPGLYAAGDSNDLWGEQIIIAAGEGAKAAMRSAQYLSLLKK